MANKKKKPKMKIPHEEVIEKVHTKYEEEPIIKGKTKYDEDAEDAGYTKDAD